MSNRLAVATVTAALRHLLQRPAEAAVNGAAVTTDRPASGANGPTGARVNVFLYQMLPNASGRNVDLPTRRPDGAVDQRPTMAIDLHYLLTFYGSETQLEPQRLLGSVVSALHAQPLLTHDAIRATVNAAATTDPDHYLGESDLANEIQTVKLTPLSLNLEELSKLWSVFFQTPYSLSVAYEASMVFIEADVTPREALPVRTPAVQVVPFLEPVVERVVAAAGEDAPIVAGTAVLIQGSGLAGVGVQVRIIESHEPTVLESVGEREVRLKKLPDALGAGVHRLQVVHPGAKMASNVAPFVLHPTVKKVEADNVHDAGNGLCAAEVKVTLAPAVVADQRVTLLLNEQNPPAGRHAHAYTFDAPPWIGAPSAVVTIAAAGVRPGAYLVRVRVDGAESRLSVGSDGRYVGPAVNISSSL